MPPKNIGPGPGAYLLPTTVGYERHDATRHRGPQYSIRGKYPIGPKPFGPGPNYNVDKLTRHGKVSPPAYTCAKRLQPLTPFLTPGPGAYSPEKGPRMRDPRPPAYSMKFRIPPLKKFNTPGPNQYAVPSTLGPKVPNKPAAAAYSMSTKPALISKERSPGPAQYREISGDVYRHRNPQYTMGKKTEFVKEKNPSPGPAAYLPAFAPSLPGGRSFGRRVEITPYITAEDALPCID